MSIQFPQVFKKPQLNIYSRSSGSRHARTKIPRYLRNANQALKAVYNWGRWDGASADAINAKHDELMKTLRAFMPNEAVWDETQREQTRAILEMVGRSPRLQKALRANGYRGPFQSVD